MLHHIQHHLARIIPIVAIVLLAGCSIAQPRTDDPWEGFNRDMYAFNNAVDKAVVKPVAEGYQSITTPAVREHVSDFFTNLRMPITIVNQLLQGHPWRAAQSTGRFVVNIGIGILGFFDPASMLGIPKYDTDFGVTLARWGVPEGPFVMLPFFGPSTVRDVWHYPVDEYFLNPISIYSRNHSYKYGQQYFPELVYLISLRASALNVEDMLESAYDPYVFLRDAYRQHRLYKIYYGHPPMDVIEKLQGLDNQGFDPEKLLEQQQQWESQQKQAAPAQ